MADTEDLKSSALKSVWVRLPPGPPKRSATVGRFLFLPPLLKLRAPWNPGPLDLTEPSREYYAVVAPMFEKAAKLVNKS